MAGGVARGIGSVLLLTGAFAIGGVLHQAFVEGTLGATSPGAVGGVLVGVVLVLVGKRLEGGRPPRPPGDGDDESEDGEGEHEDEDGDGDREFDERFSPIDESDLSDRERDDDYEGRS